MMKIKNVSVCVLASALALSCLAGCGNKQEIDETKSTLNVGVFKAGVGTTWLANSIKDFEAYYAGTSFEEGKTGVQVIMEEKTEEFKATNLSATMSSLDNAIYFLEQSDFTMFMSKGLLADITDTINEKVYDDGGNLVADKAQATKSILDTMNDEWVGYHERDGRYYALPFRAHVGGIIYDADLFNANKYYFFNDGEMGATQADIDKGASGNIGTGPDGEVGTADDGMPVTYSDFTKLMQKMVEDDVIPFTWAGSTAYQRMYAYDSVFANYQGYNDYALNWSFSGTTTDGRTVTEDNVQDILVEQEGRKAAIQFFRDITSNTKHYSTKAMNQSHNAAQFEFIDSTSEDAKSRNEKPIAMFMEGGYWENEARTHFDNAARLDASKGYGKRDFRIMPIPNFVGTEGITDQTNTSEDEVFVGRTNDSMICLAKTTKAKNPELQLSLAKLFLQFVQSREQMSNFVRDTGGCFRTYKFSATKEELAEWTKYGQSIYRYLEQGSKIIPDMSRSKKRMNIYADGEYKWSFTYQSSEAGALPVSDPVSAFITYPDLSVNDCFDTVKSRLKAAASKA